MTSEERLAQIENILLQNTSQISTLLETQIRSDRRFEGLQTELSRHAADMRASIEDLVQVGIDTYQLAMANNAAIRIMQAEVRGLQTENRRILERLEAHMGDGHGS
jgi:hypothetical protein